MQKSTAPKFDKVAKIYNTIIFQFFYFGAHKACIKFIENYLKNNDKILDIACGTGIFLRKLHKKNSSLKLFGIDNSRGMTDFAKKNSGLINFSQAEADKIPFQDKSFDFATIIDAFYYFQDKEEVFKECSRILKNNGYLFIFYPSADLMPNFVVYLTKISSRLFFFNLEEYSFFWRRKKMKEAATRFNLKPIKIKTKAMHSFLLFQKV